jgi:hypothetical protein
MSNVRVMDIRCEGCTIVCGQKLDSTAAHPLPKQDGFRMLLRGIIFVVVRCVFQVCGLVSSYNRDLPCAMCLGPGRGGASFLDKFGFGERRLNGISICG